MDVPELMPMDDYDSRQANFEASIQWLALRAYGRDIPKRWQQPFQEVQPDKFILKKDLEVELTSGDIYCKVCGAIFKKEKSTWKGLSDVIQALSRRGFYVTDLQDTVVTVEMLQAPFKPSAHVALSGALMTAYAAEIVTVERVVKAVKKFTSFAASSELPYDVEDALMFWINKVCSATRQQLDQGRPPDSQRGGVCTSMASMLCRWHSAPNSDSESSSPSEASASSTRLNIPTMDDLVRDIGDGCCLATLISFYCPNYLRLADVYLCPNPGIADSLCNIQLILEFCSVSLPVRPLVLSLNDLFYAHFHLKSALLAFLAELFYWLEIERAPCVRDVTKPLVSVGEGEGDGGGEGDVDDTSSQHSQQGENETTDVPAKHLRRPPIPISNATKRSFHSNSGPIPGDLQSLTATSSPDLHKESGVTGPRQPLLPRRLSQQRNSIHEGEGVARGSAFRRSRSLPSVEEVTAIPRQSMRAWEERTDGTQGSSPHSNRRGQLNNSHATNSTAHSTLTNVTRSGESQRSLLANVSIDSDMDADLGADTSLDMSEFEPSPRQPSDPSWHNVEDMRLQSVSTSRTARSGRTANGTGHLDPLLPAQLRPSKEKSANHTKEMESGEDGSKKKSPTSGKPMTLSLRQADSSSGSSTPDEDYKTPSAENVPLPGERKLRSPVQSKQAPDSSRNKQYEAFYVDAKASGGSAPHPETQSFTLHKSHMTREAAQAAGIPVIDSYKDVPHNHHSNHHTSSREGVDRELQKIHADHHDKENKDVKESFFLNAEHTDTERPGSLDVAQFQMDRSLSSVSSDDRPSPKTSFAQIKKAKDSGEVSPIVYTQVKTPQKGALKAGNSGAPKGAKKTTFATLPNQTTWQESAQKKAISPDTNSDVGSDTVEPLPSELLDIRMRLEERRRQIETDKRRMQAQLTKQRQRVGKQAFIQVVTKGKEDTKDSPPAVDGSNKDVAPEGPKPDAVSAVDRYKDAKHQGYREKVNNKPESDKEGKEDHKGAAKASTVSQPSPKSERKLVESLPPKPSPTTRRRRSPSPERVTTPPPVRQESPSPERVSPPSKQRHSPERTKSPLNDRRPSQFEDAMESQRRVTKPAKRSESMRSPGEDRPRPRPARRSESPQAYEKSQDAYRSESPEHSSASTKDHDYHQHDREADRRRYRADSEPRLDRGESERRSVREDSRSKKSSRPVTRSESERRPRSHTDPDRRYSESPRESDSRYMNARPWQQDDSPTYEERRRRDERSPERKPNEERQGDHISRGSSFESAADVEHEIEKERIAKARLEQAESKLRHRSSSPHGERRPSPGRMAVSDHRRSAYASHKEPQAAMSKSDHGDLREGKTSEYGTSLDKLNSSLTELQGEIMRLSLQRDHLKEEVDGSAPPATSSPAHTEASPPKDPYYSYANNSVGEPDIAGAGRMVTAAGMYGHPNALPYQAPPSSMYGMQGPYQPPQPHPGQYMPPHYMGQPGYPPLVQPQFTTNPLYQPQPGMYPQPGFPPGQWPPQITPYGHHPVSAPQHYAHTSTVNSHPGELPSPSQQDPIISRPDLHGVQSTHSSPQSPLGVTTNLSSPASVTSPASGASSQKSAPVASSPERGWSATSPEPIPTLPLDTASHSGSHGDEAEGEPPDSPKEASAQQGFFISFESDSPRRQKPKLGSVRNRDTPSKSHKDTPTKSSKSKPSRDNGKPVSKSPPSPAAPSPAPEPQATPPCPAVETEPQVPVPSPGVAFVLGEEQLAESEIERKKAKILQQQAKRREEAEKKRLKQERDRQATLEQKRLKEERQEQKKAEEKARREEIFQNYQRRKAEEAAAEQNAKDPPVVRRAKPKAKPKRPMSQPPIMTSEDKHSHSSSSQEDLYPKGGNGMSQSAHSDVPDSGGSLAFGGITHRRPPSPVKRITHEITPPFLLRAVDYKPAQVMCATPPKNKRPSLSEKRPSFSDTNSDAGSLAGDRAYVGPKLFVKPSSKSNRHIIQNAISHCCLAGTVNGNIKNKVLEELTRSEDKHFIILFRDGGQQYRAVYSYFPEPEELIVKLVGTGPKQINNSMIERFYKYNSGAKSFTEVTSTKHVSVSIDAITIQNHYWQKKPAAPKKAMANLY